MQIKLYFTNSSFAIFPITILFIFISNSISYSQNIPNKKQSFEIINNGNILDIKSYYRSIEKANFDPYRLINNRREIKFDNGFVIELYSANELLETYGKKINYATTQLKGTEIEYPKIFTISESGHIIELMEVVPKKSAELEKSTVKN